MAQKTNLPTFITFGFVILVAIFVGYNIITEIAELNNGETTEAESLTTLRSGNQQRLEDGTYTATLDYDVPQRHTETIDITIGIEGGEISAVQYTNTPSNIESEFYQGTFDDAFNSNDLVGQEIETAELSKVGSASLTTAAFNDALDQIRANAR